MEIKTEINLLFLLLIIGLLYNTLSMMFMIRAQIVQSLQYDVTSFQHSEAETL